MQEELKCRVKAFLRPSIPSILKLELLCACYKKQLRHEHIRTVANDLEADVVIHNGRMSVMMTVPGGNYLMLFF